jgi:hypothetical protein
MENPGEGCKKGLGKSRGRVRKTAEIQGVGWLETKIQGMVCD